MPIFSIVTPTDSVENLYRCYSSIKRQTITDWEWILVLNGQIQPSDIDAEIRADSRVVIDHVLPARTHHRLGAYRRKGCTQANGQYIFELDSDDELVPHSLSRVLESVQEANGFYYGDYAVRLPNGEFQIPSKIEGGESYTEKIDDKSVTVTANFDPHPAAFLDHRYVPNYGKIWSRDCYKHIGGHDPALFAGEDVDIAVRTYLSGRPFHHIKKLIYIKNWSSKGFRQQEQYRQGLQEFVSASKTDYIHKLIHEWARRSGKPMVTISLEPMEGFIHIPPSEIYNMSHFIDGECSVIRSVRGMEYTSMTPQEITRQAHKLLTPGGFFLGAFPDGNGNACHTDDRIKHHIREANFYSFTDKHMNASIPNDGVRFQVMQLDTEAPTDWHMSRNLLYTSFTFCALKGQRFAGKTDA
jgi:glycosyltransferase involved in cell wall biosynthesis